MPRESRIFRKAGCICGVLLVVFVALPGSPPGSHVVAQDATIEDLRISSATYSITDDRHYLTVDAWLSNAFSTNFFDWLIYHFTTTTEIRFEVELWKDNWWLIDDKLATHSFRHRVSFDRHSWKLKVMREEEGWAVHTFAPNETEEAARVLRRLWLAPVYPNGVTSDTELHIKVRACLPSFFFGGYCTDWNESEHINIQIEPVIEQVMWQGDGLQPVAGGYWIPKSSFFYCEVNLGNTGTQSSEAAYFSISYSSGLTFWGSETVSAGGSAIAFYSWQAGQLISHRDGTQFHSEFGLVDTQIIPFQSGSHKSIRLVFRATSAGPQWLKYRATYHAQASDDLCVSVPVSGEVDEQGWPTSKVSIEVREVTGNIYVTTNRQDATWSIVGPQSYEGTGNASINDAPQGYYTITWGAVPGCTKPPSESKILIAGSSITFNGNYTCPPQVCPAPTNLSATAQSQTSILLTWQDNCGNEDSFRIYRNGTYVTSVSAGTTSWTDTGLSCGTTYSYYVKAHNAAGDSPASNTAYATTLTCPPDCVDVYEPDDSPWESGFRGNFGPGHRFCEPGDEDWARFTGAYGHRYTVTTSGLGTRSDTTLCMFVAEYSQGELVLDPIGCDDAPGPSKVSTVGEGEFLVRVRNRDASTFGPETYYDLDYAQECDDPNEPANNIPDGASLVSTHGTPLYQRFCADNDTDWFKFHATTGRVYTTTVACDPTGQDYECGPRVELYAQDASTLLLVGTPWESPPYLVGERIVWTAPVDGFYYLKCRNYHPSASGPHTAYWLEVTAGISPPPSTEAVSLEAENGMLDNTYMKRNYSTEASSCYYISTTTRLEGTATLTFPIAQSGYFNVWGRTRVKDYTHNSFTVTVGSALPFRWEIVPEGGSWGTWTWGKVFPVDTAPTPFWLTAGTNTIHFRGREIETCLDKLIITNDLNYRPGSQDVAPCGPTATPERRLRAVLPVVFKTFEYVP